MNIVTEDDAERHNFMVENTLNSSFRGVVVGDRDVLTRFVESHNDTYEKLRFAKEIIYSFGFGIPMRSAHFFFEPYNDHINYYMEAGLVEKSIKTHYSNLKQQIEISKEEKEPEVLTMNHLGAAFVVCFIPAIFGLIAFVGELYNIKRKQEVKLKSKLIRRVKIKRRKRRQRNRRQRNRRQRNGRQRRRFRETLIRDRTNTELKKNKIEDEIKDLINGIEHVLILNSAQGFSSFECPLTQQFLITSLSHFPVDFLPQQQRDNTVK